MLRSGCNDASFIPSDGVHLFERWRPSMDQGSKHRNKWFPPKPGRMDDDIELINSEFGLTFGSCYFRKTARPFWYFGDGMLRWAEQMGIQKFCSLVTEIFQKPRKKPEMLGGVHSSPSSQVSLHVHGVSWWPNPKSFSTSPVILVLKTTRNNNPAPCLVMRPLTFSSSTGREARACATSIPFGSFGWGLMDEKCQVTLDGIGKFISKWQLKMPIITRRLHRDKGANKTGTVL